MTGFGNDPVIEIARQELKDGAASELMRLCPGFVLDGNRIPKRMIDNLARSAGRGKAAKIRGIVRTYNRLCDLPSESSFGPSRRRDPFTDRHVQIAVRAAA